jgi:hypothetical protein
VLQDGFDFYGHPWFWACFLEGGYRNTFRPAVLALRSRSV